MKLELSFYDLIFIIDNNESWLYFKRNKKEFKRDNKEIKWLVVRNKKVNKLKAFRTIRIV